MLISEFPRVVVYWAKDLASPAEVVCQYPGDAAGWAASLVPRNTEGGMDWIVVEAGDSQLPIIGMKEWLDENTIPASPTFEWWEQQVKNYEEEQQFIYEKERFDW